MSSTISAGEMIGRAGRDMDDLDQPRRRMIAAEPQRPAALAGETAERMAGFDRDFADRHRAEAAAALVEPAVDEQQPRALMLCLDPGQRVGYPAGRLRFRQAPAAPKGRSSLGRDHSPPGLIQIVHVSTGAADHLAGEIVLDTDAQALVVESFIGEGWANRLTGITLNKSARLMLHRRSLGPTGFVSLTDHGRLGAGASLVLATLALGGRDTRLDGEIDLQGEGAYAEAAGALLARGRQRHDANLVIRHRVMNGTSRQVWRSVADDKAACSVAARVEVARGAQKTDGEQSLKGLLLARSATINAKPELEIFADDVKCARGATVGELDGDALFYLESRGVEPDEAKGLLTRAFVADALDRIGDENVRAAFYADAEGWFA